MPTSANRRFSNRRCNPAIAPELAVPGYVKLAASKTFVAGTVLGEKIGTDSKQSLTPSTGANAITGGTYKLTYATIQTAAINATASAADIQAALEALSSIGAGNVLVTGGPLMSGVVYIEFRGTLGNAARTAISVDATSLTSGGAAAVTVNAAVVAGAAGTPEVYDAYAEGHTDGTGVGKCILQVDCATDGSGNITFGNGGQTVGEWGETHLTAPIWWSGFFRAADLTGLDGALLASQGWQLKQGTLTTGLVRLI
jgi:hypothetical protein